MLTLNKSVRREADGDFALKAFKQGLTLMKRLDDGEFKHLQQVKDVYCIVLSAEATKDNKTSK